MPIESLVVGDCPKCGNRTFLIYQKTGELGTGSLKGKCYKCGHEQNV
jgi:hypothetical protein